MAKLLLIVTFAFTINAVAPCYKFNGGHNQTSEIYTPRNQQTPFSMCFRSQKDQNGAPADTMCLPQGLSQNLYNNRINYRRQSCTDPTWKSPYCLTAFDECPSDFNGNAMVTPCGDIYSTKWCCGSNTTCCEGPSAIVIAAMVGVSSTTSSTSTSQTSSTSSQPTISSSITQSSTSIPFPTAIPITTSNKSELSTGATAGIAIAATLGTIAILSGIVLFALVTIRKSRDSKNLLHEVSDDQPTPPPPFEYKQHIHEAPGEIDMEKLKSGNEFHEAPGAETFGSSAEAYRYQQPVELPSASNNRYQ